MNSSILNFGSQYIQEVNFLQDVSSTGKKIDWRFRKLKTDFLADVYKFLYDDFKVKSYFDKSLALKNCSFLLQFAVLPNGKKKLINGNFCRVRLCPMCGWRRTLKIYANVSKLIEHMNGYKFVFLTLTVKSCSGDELSFVLDKMFYGWNLFAKFKVFKDAVKGFYRGLEVTYNKRTNMYHPHFHCLLAVESGYFTGKDYLKFADWQKLWKSAMKLDYNPVVDVRKVKGNFAKSVCEIAKYTVKDKDYIDFLDLKGSADIVKVLDLALKGRRLVSFGGIMKKLHKQLNLGDEIDGSLENITQEEKDKMSDLVKVTYAWNVGFRNYVQVPDFDR